MNNGSGFSKVRIFVASPSDVGPERERVKRVAERLNRQGAAADQARIVLEVLGWETHVASHMGRPEDVILSQLPVDEWDIFVGILWTRFGSPSGAQNPDSGEEYASGTEEEFLLAYRAWKEQERPRICLYRCIRSPQRLDLINVEQLAKLSEFFKRFEAHGDHPGLYKTFAEWGDFENELEKDLTHAIREMAKRFDDRDAPGARDRHSTSKDERKSTDDYFRDFAPNSSYQLGFLSIDIVDHSRLIRASKDPKSSQELISNFKYFVTDAAVRHNGCIFSWAGDGGILAFHGPHYQTRTILAGIHLLHNLVLFNLDRSLNPLGVNISLRMAANDATIIFQLPTDSIASDDLNLTVHLQESGTAPGEFCATDALLAGVEESLRKLFTSKGRYNGIPIYAYRQNNDSKQATESAMQELLHDCEIKGKALQDILCEDNDLSRDELEGVSALLDHFYSSLNTFCSWFSPIDERWSSQYLEKSARVATSLISIEGNLFDQVKLLHRVADDPEVEALALIVSGRRSKPVISLDKLKTVLERRATGAPQKGSDSGTSQIQKKITRLTGADDLEQETALTDLLLNNKEDLIDYLTQKNPPPAANSLINQLWKLSDLIIQDDYHSLNDHRRRRDRQLFEAIARSPVNDARFSGVQSLLSSTGGIEDNDLASSFKECGHSMDDGDREIAWRCIIVGHRQEDVRRIAADKLSLNSIWQIISRSRLPLDTINQLGLRFRGETEEQQKIFFDCVRGKILEEIQKTNDRIKLAVVTKIVIALLTFDFLAETIYFERFDQLLGEFLLCVDRLQFKVDYVEKLRAHLKKEWQQRGEQSGSTPKKIRELPLPLQRRLAGEAPYLLWFVSHPDQRIALETFRHINLNNVERILHIPEINESLMATILAKGEFFGRISTVTAALMNPKCTVRAARRYLPVILRSGHAERALQSIFQNPSTNSQIRALVRSKLTESKSTAKRT